MRERHPANLSRTIHEVRSSNEEKGDKKQQPQYSRYLMRLRNSLCVRYRPILLAISFIILLICNLKSINDRQHDKEMKMNDGPCALLFFGLLKSFENIALPSIREKILKNNSHCDIFLHTYDIEFTPSNRRNRETHGEKVNLTKAYLLTDNVMFETEESFYEKRKLFLEHTQKNSHKLVYGKCCLAHDNIIKQWNSIAGAWDLMRQKEIELLGNDNGHYYKHVGLFRTDTYMVTNIPNISGSTAVAPAFASFGGQNDRMFYGSYENARIWADRFAFYEIFEENYMIRYSFMTPKVKFTGYHSEYYLGKLMKHYNIKVEFNEICLWRIRNQGGLLATDCLEQELRSDNLPAGYDSNVTVEAKNGKIYYHWSQVWDQLAVPKEWNKWDKQLKMNNTEKGVIILSMHGSRSSQLYSLLMYGYHDGENKNVQFTIPSQNDAFLWGQGLDWKSNMDKYNHSLTMEMLKNNTLPTLAGIIGLDSLTDKENGPWLMEDPRLSITLKSWLTFLNTPPAIVFAFRNPLEVARILAEKGDSIKKFLVLWIQYNKAAIQNSKNLCRVLVDTTNLHNKVSQKSKRIVRELSEKCGVKSPFMENIHVENVFRDIVSIDFDKLFETYNGCEIHDYHSIHESEDIDEKRLYIMAMELYCDLKSGKALQDNYLWPEITRRVVASLFENRISKRQVEENVRESYIKKTKHYK